MNTDQWLSLIRGVLLAGGTALAEHGWVTNDQWTAIVAGLVAFGSVVWSQVFHKTNGA